MYKSYLDLLTKTSLFNGINKDDLEELLTESIDSTIKKYKKGDYIFAFRDPARHFFIVLSGDIVIEEIKTNGERIIDRLETGAIFGLVSVYSPVGHYLAYAYASGESVVMMIGSALLTSGHIQSLPQRLIIAENMIKIVGKRVYELNLRVLIFSFKTIRGKIAFHLTSKYNIKRGSIVYLPYNRNEFADFLCVSRTSLSRELARMKDEGIIDYYQNAIIVKDLGALEVAMNEKDKVK